MGGTKLFTFKFIEQKGVEPISYYADNIDFWMYDNVQGCYSERHPLGERAFCAALIKYNGWTIPKDYQLKILNSSRTS